MGLRINSNVASLIAQNNLKSTTKRLNQSLTRLSTGLRINTGADDVVGLTKSELLRGRIRGLGVAQQNVSNATAFLGVSEGYLSQLTEIAQQMRESAVQAADSTVDPSSRAAIVDDFNTQLQEYDRLASGANYLGINLIDGTFTNKELQIGANEGETLSISINDARSSTIGRVAVFTSVSLSSTSTLTTGAASAAFTDPGTTGISFQVGTSTYTVDTGAFEDDGVSNIEGDESAIAYVNAINQLSAESGIKATALSNVVTIDYSAGQALSSIHHMVINGITVKNSSLNVTAGDDTDASTLVSLINDASTQTGVTATLDVANDEIVLTASDGRNINVRTAGTGVSNYNVFGVTGASANTQITYRGTFKLSSENAFTIVDTSDVVGANNSDTANIDTSTSLVNASLTNSDNAAEAITILDNVLTQLQARRSEVGSVQARLNNVLAELESREENLTAAESAIRDADIAVETARLTQDQILQQAGITVLAQANASPQIALSLLASLN